MNNLIYFLGTSAHALSTSETIELIRSRLKENQFTQHVVINVAKLVTMQTDAILRASVNACDIINIDGMGVVWGARLLGHKVPERVAGVDLFYRLLAMSAENQFPVFLLGAKPDIVTKTVQVVEADYPGLRIAGFHHGYIWNEEEQIVDEIAKSGAKLLFVAITSPQKENFINKWRDKLGVDFVMGVGGTFDVVAGKVKRAPLWMQKWGLEWLYRIIQEPRRMWKRYLVTNSKFAWLLLKELIRKRTKG